MKTIEIDNALIVSTVDEQVKMRNEEWRAKQTVLFTENTGNGTILHGCVVWDDNIGKLNLQQSKTYNLHCRLVGRQWGGRFSYELVAFRADAIEQAQQEQHDQQEQHEQQEGTDVF